MTDNIYWVARYVDGSYLMQYNADKSENRYADIKRNLLKEFELWKGFDNPQLLLRVHFDTPDKKLIYRRQTHQSPAKVFVRYLIGWQMKVRGKNVQSICIYDTRDGSVENIGRWREYGENDFVFFEKPTIHPHEGEDWE